MGLKIVYSYKTGISTEEHNNLVKLGNRTNLLQSSNQVKVKDNQDNERTGFYEDDALVTSAFILAKVLPLGSTMPHISHEPIVDYSDKELAAFVTSSLKKYGKIKHSFFAKIDPILLFKQYKIGGEVDGNKDTLAIIGNSKTVGCEWIGRTITITGDIQSRFQINVYTQGDMTVTFPKYTRRLMKDIIHRGVITNHGTVDDVKAFADVVALTENRKGVAPRSEDYFRKMMETYGDDTYLHLAKVNLPKRLTGYKGQLAQIKKDLSETAEHQKKRLTKLTQQESSATKYIAEFKELAEKYPDELIIAGILPISLGNVMEMLYANTGDELKESYPQYSLYPKVFEDAYTGGIIWVDMGGVEGTLDDDLTKFKPNLNPTIEEFIEELNASVNPPLHKLPNLAYNIRRQRRDSH